MKNQQILCGSHKLLFNPLEGSFDLQGHRGARGKRPENTIPAFTYCIEKQMTTIELDINVTRDKQLIVNHDTTVNGEICIYENGAPAEYIPIKQLTVKELKRLDCGALVHKDFPEQIAEKNTRLITLLELFDYVRDYEQTHDVSTPILFNIETKFGEGFSLDDVCESARLVVDTIESAEMTHRSTVQSFVHEVLPEVRQLNRCIQTSALFEPTSFQSALMKMGIRVGQGRIVKKAIWAKADIISPDFCFVDKGMVHRCHKHHLKVLPWVVNDEQTMKKMLDLGVDGIISDYPDRLHRAYSVWLAKRSPDA